MKYTYSTATGPVEIDIDEKWAKVLNSLDNEDFNNYQKENRRHISINTNEGKFIVDPHNDIEELFKEDELTLKEKLPYALESLKRLKPNQYAIIKAIYFDGIKQADYAKQCGVSQGAISQRLATAKKR